MRLYFLKNTEFYQGKHLTFWVPDREKTTVKLEIVSNSGKWTPREADSQTRDLLSLAVERLKQSSGGIAEGRA